MQITTPGFYDLDAATYHADPVPGGSLSQSALGVLLDEAGPARFKHQQENPREPKTAWNLGSTVHALLLGKGGERIVQIDAPDYRTKKAREARDEAYAQDLTPMLNHQYAQAIEVVDAVPEHIKNMFTGGDPEVSMFWQHPTGEWVRGQADYLTDDLIIDLKTSRDTTLRHFARDVHDFKYYLQAAWYSRLAHELDGKKRGYLIVAVETTAPYLSRVFTLSQEYLDLGARHMEEAIRIYRECKESGEWPGHLNEIVALAPPLWALDQDADNLEF